MPALVVADVRVYLPQAWLERTPGVDDEEFQFATQLQHNLDLQLEQDRQRAAACADASTREALLHDLEVCAQPGVCGLKPDCSRGITTFPCGGCCGRSAIRSAVRCLTPSLTANCTRIKWSRATGA